MNLVTRYILEKTFAVTIGLLVAVWYSVLSAQHPPRYPVTRENNLSLMAPECAPQVNGDR